VGEEEFPWTFGVSHLLGVGFWNLVAASSLVSRRGLKAIDLGARLIIHVGRNSSTRWRSLQILVIPEGQNSLQTPLPLF
jgi:hypothetical protein